MDGLKTYEPEEGRPQSAVISLLLSSIYLDPLDHMIAESGYEMVRHADVSFEILPGYRALPRA